MAFQVLQDNIPCAEYGIKTWDVDTFSTLEQAIVFAYHWAYPYDMETIAQNVTTGIWTMKPGIDYDMSMGETPITMKILEI